MNGRIPAFRNKVPDVARRALDCAAVDPETGIWLVTVETPLSQFCMGCPKRPHKSPLCPFGAEKPEEVALTDDAQNAQTPAKDCFSLGRKCAGCGGPLSNRAKHNLCRKCMYESEEWRQTIREAYRRKREKRRAMFGKMIPLEEELCANP